MAQEYDGKGAGEGLEPLVLAPVAVVRCGQKEAVDEGWGELRSELHVREGLGGGLTGLESFSHVWVVTWLHEARFVAERHLRRHPRDDERLPQVGIFAQRARHRPNRIGISACEVVEVRPDEGVLVVQGLDAIDGTPVLDIKPYVGVFDGREETRIPAWMQEIMQGYF